jgi:hypothetical protein
VGVNKIEDGREDGKSVGKGSLVRLKVRTTGNKIVRHVLGEKVAGH